MKIVATVSNGRFLAEVEEGEIAKMLGFDSPHEMREKGRVNLSVGSEIKVHELWRAVAWLRARPDEMSRLASRLQVAARDVLDAAAVLESPIIKLPG